MTQNIFLQNKKSVIIHRYRRPYKMFQMVYMCDAFSETDVFLFQSVLPNEPGCFTWARTTHSLWEAIHEVPEHLGRVQLQFGNISFSIFNIFLTNIV